MAGRDDGGEYLSLVIHELRNPLVGIDAAARVMARDLGRHPAARRAERVAEEARHLLELLESVTDAEAAASGRLRSVPRRTDLRSVVRDAVADAAHLAGRSISVRLPDPAVPVKADARRLRQVLVNLLANAAQYSPPDRPIDVTLSVDQRRRRATVEVRDRGPGIPLAQRRRLFRRFVRLSTADGTRGSGLGLYISKAIVEDHKGTIHYAAARGGGSVFGFTLPLTAAARSRQRRKA
ncbi:MAG: sensor histidine kinase [Candidatus Limnocylindria bacterium]